MRSRAREHILHPLQGFYELWRSRARALKRAGMRTVAYFKRQAAECRALAEQADFTEHRDRLLKVAEDWEALAAEREALLPKQVEVMAKGEGEAQDP